MTPSLRWIGAVAVAALGCATGATERRMANQDPFAGLRGEYLALVSAARAQRLQPVGDREAFEDRALLDSTTWCRRVLRAAANPHRAENHAVRAYRPADARARIDLLEHQLTVGKAELRIYEASPFLLVVVPLAAAERADPLAQAARAAQLLLDLPAPVVFLDLPSGTGPRSFSTNPELAPERLRDWRKRVDGVLLDEGLGLIVYKATLDEMMKLFGDPGRWFEQLRKVRP